MHCRAAVVGVGESTYYQIGRSPHSALQLAAVAIERAVGDAGLRMSDVDGLVTWGDRNDPANLASWLGFGNLRFSANPSGGGGNLGAAVVNLADAAICSGQADVVVAYRGINQGREGHYGRARSLSPAAGEAAFLTPFGVAAPVVRNALLSSTFMHDHRVSQDSLANIALAAYGHAQRNPRAVMHGRELTRSDYHKSRWIAEPFHLFDCCQASDGAAAVVVTSSDRAVGLPNRPAFILAGTSGMERLGGLWSFNDSAFPNGRFRSVAGRLWEQAGIAPGDVQVAQFYENFTGTTLMAICDMGFCEPGGVNEFVADGNIQWPTGGLPINTSGGNLAEAYIHGFQLVNEAVRQIRGDSTAQVRDVELSLCVAGPGTPPSSAVLLASHT